MMHYTEELTSLCSHIPDNQQQEGLLILNPQGRIIHATRSIADFFDVNLTSITGKLFDSLFPTYEQQGLHIKMHQLRKNTVVQHRTTKKGCANKNTHTFVLHPITSHGRIHMIIVTLQNTHLLDQLRFERDLSLGRERLCKEAISHHFFNPLAIAKGYLQLTVDNCDDDIKDNLCAINVALDRIETAVKTIIKTGSPVE